MPQRGGTTLATPGKRGGVPTARRRAHRAGDGGGRLPAASAPPPAPVDQAACTLQQGSTARRRRPLSSAFFAAAAELPMFQLIFYGGTCSFYSDPGARLSCVGRATHALVANSHGCIAAAGGRRAMGKRVSRRHRAVGRQSNELRRPFLERQASYSRHGRHIGMCAHRSRPKCAMGAIGRP